MVKLLVNKTLFFFLFFLSSVNGFSQEYKGMVDVGYVFEANKHNQERAILSTTHGVNLTPAIFLGAGVQMDILTDKTLGQKRVALPLFLNFNWTLFPHKSFSPFIDLRGGYSVAGNTGHYVAWGIGVQYKVTKSNSLILSVGGEYQKYKYTFQGEKDCDLNNGPFVRVGFVF